MLPINSPEMRVVQNSALRFFLFALGILAIALGLIGVLLPILPTTPFVLLGAWCFLKSSPKAHGWLLRQPYLGQALHDWERDQSISRSTKVVAVAMIAFSVILIWFKVKILWLKVSIIAILGGVSVFFSTRNERR